jgi:hypothetical protein
MTLTKAIISPSSTSVTGGTLVTLDGSTSTAQDNTTLSGQDAFLFEQLTGPIVALKATPTHEGSSLTDSVQFNAPTNRPNSKLSFKLTVKDSGGTNINRSSHTSDVVTITVTS